MMPGWSQSPILQRRCRPSGGLVIGVGALVVVYGGITVWVNLPGNKNKNKNKNAENPENSKED